jgi:hypothetical protein
VGTGVPQLQPAGEDGDLRLIYHDEYAKQGNEWKITKSRSEFKTALHCSYAAGPLEAQLAARSVAGAVSYEK